LLVGVVLVLIFSSLWFNRKFKKNSGKDPRGELLKYQEEKRSLIKLMMAMY